MKVSILYTVYMHVFIHLLTEIIYSILYVYVCIYIHNYIWQGWEVDRLPLRIFLIESLKITLSQNGW